MYNDLTPTLPPGADRGPMQGVGVIGEITESIHKHLMDGWEFERARPRIEEDLSFVPKDREEVVYVYMYKTAMNRALMNNKRFRGARVTLPGSDKILLERPPLYLDVFYMIAVHAKFRSDAERLLGYCILRLHEASHLLYRPRKFILPSGDAVNSKGDPWSMDVDMNDDEIIFEKVAVTWVDDLTIGDAINFFTIQEAPYRPYLTFMARCAMDGALVTNDPTTVRTPSVDSMNQASRKSPSGRIRNPVAADSTSGRFKTPFGPQGHNPRRIDETGNPTEHED